MMFIQAGRYYVQALDGELIDIGPAAPGQVDVVVCRRVVDFPHGQIPEKCGLARCAVCEAPIVYNLEGPHRGVERVCMQCTEIQPLPLEES